MSQITPPGHEVIQACVHFGTTFAHCTDNHVTAFAIEDRPESASKPIAFKWRSTASLASAFVQMSAVFSFVSVLNSSNTFSVNFF